MHGWFVILSVPGPIQCPVFQRSYVKEKGTWTEVNANRAFQRNMPNAKRIAVYLLGPSNWKITNSTSIMRQPTRSRTQKDMEYKKPGRTGNLRIVSPIFSGFPCDLPKPFHESAPRSHCWIQETLLDLLNLCGCKSDAASCQRLAISEQRWHTNFYQLRECKLMMVNGSQWFYLNYSPVIGVLFQRNIIYPLHFRETLFEW